MTETRAIRSKGHLFNIVPDGTTEWCVTNLPAIDPPSSGLTYLFGLWRYEFGIDLVNRAGYQLFRIETVAERSASQRTSLDELKAQPEVVFLDTVNSEVADYLDGGSGRYKSNIGKAVTENPNAVLTELMARPEFGRCIGIVWHANASAEFQGTSLSGSPLRVITIFDRSRVVAIDCLSAPGAFDVLCPFFGRPVDSVERAPSPLRSIAR